MRLMPARGHLFGCDCRLCDRCWRMAAYATDPTLRLGCRQRGRRYCPLLLHTQPMPKPDSTVCNKIVASAVDNVRSVYDTYL
ncbi:hypothetical protein B296_00057885 [Ensete ventricosum]|uniref:Uncharacterized protein n=1 Tax=Ensete ventricosum TaxID=4639 RepID=A0A426WZ92_ENSVE|nr:hypothetical protein B296_00057885 [Ensete ventricosum]